MIIVMLQVLCMARDATLPLMPLTRIDMQKQITYHLLLLCLFHINLHNQFPNNRSICIWYVSLQGNSLKVEVP